MQHGTNATCRKDIDRMRIKIRSVILVVSIGITVATGVLFFTGYMLCRPAQVQVEKPDTIPFENITITSTSGAELKGWKLVGLPNKNVIILFHSIRSNRSLMINRAKMLWEHGYTIILFDFQAHGESKGKHITFGYLESKDVESIYEYVKNIYPQKKVGAIGISLGGASILLRKDMKPFDALLLEAVYPTIEEATFDRIQRRLGFLAPFVSPVMLSQLNVQIHITKNELKPIENIGKQNCPILIIAGKLDEHTKIAESERMFINAKEPKELWVIENAKHEDFYKKRPKEYEERVLKFFGEYLK